MALKDDLSGKRKNDEIFDTTGDKHREQRLTFFLLKRMLKIDRTVDQVALRSSSWKCTATATSTKYIIKQYTKRN